MLLNPLTFHVPKTLLEAAKLYIELGDVKVLAGGTFLLNSLKLLKRHGTKTPKNILSLRKIQELKGIEADDQKMAIKAMTTINEVFDSPFLTDNFAVFRTVCRNISTNPIRNMATVGGNLTCRYTWTELGAVMVALDAQMHFMGSDGKEEIVPAEQFFKNAAKTDKLFTQVTIKRDKTAAFAYQRMRKQSSVDVPYLALCVKTNFKGDQLTNTRVTVNSGVAFAQRDYKLEEFLNNSKSHPNLGKEALDHLDNTIYDTRSTDYKKHLFRVCLKNAINELVEKRAKK